MHLPGPSFARKIVLWQKRHGRHQLPWQRTRDPYAVWLSEVMLQQTQVSTVLEYFERFIHRFPDVHSLAQGRLDEVLTLWSGLGYYSRARHLHRCAQEVVERWGGQFPSTAAELMSLPGIGRSTAAAIAVFCFGQREAILDGNVRRVLARVLAYGADLSVAAHERALWDAAVTLLPDTDQAASLASYTQGLMDLGSSICSVRQPKCALCPVQTLCQGHLSNQASAYPVKLRRTKRSTAQWWLLKAQTRSGEIWLTQRPSPGVWAGLYCLPWFDSMDQLFAAVPAHYHDRVRSTSSVRHALTHKELQLHFVVVQLPRTMPPVMATGSAGATARGAWYTPADWAALGLPAPVRKFLM